MASDLSCTQCHNDTTLISGKVTSWEASVHGSGTAFAYAGGRSTCAGCHSGDGFSARIAAGNTNPDEFTDVSANPTRMDCRACHQIHTSYTSNDWALKTEAPVPMYAFTNLTYDGGKGNLCANCHQARRAIPAAVDGKITVDSTHWGGHHGPEALLLLGAGAGGGVTGSPSAHYSMVKDTCAACHLGGDSANHSFQPQVATCVACHADAKSLDVNGVQTEVKTKLEEVKAALQAKGLLDKDGTIVVGDYPEAQAAALWNYLLVEEDKSNGVHNAKFANDMLDAALVALK
jgi:hypothetical protein